MTTLGAFETNRVYCCDALELLRGLPGGSVNCIVTSPPYFGLRDYGVDGQIGLEETPEAFVAALVEVFQEARRALRDDGTLWLNLGDSYVGGKGQSGSQGAEHQEARNKNQRSLNRGYQTLGGKKQTKPTDNREMLRLSNIKPKDLLMIPARVALALQADGWYLRSDIIWAKPNPMPESVTDRPTKSHEHVFLFAKSASYFYDAAAISEPVTAVSGGGFSRDYAEAQPQHGSMKLVRPQVSRRNKRDVWTIPTQPYPDAHFAVMPEELVRQCVLAGCPEGGVTLDMFMGSGTVARVAHRLGRRYIGSDINAKYVDMANNSLQQMSMYEAMP